MIDTEMLPGLKEKPPICKKLTEIPEANNNIQELNFGLYTIIENNSEENLSPETNTKPDKQEFYLSNNICEIENEYELSDSVCRSEKNTDSVLQDLQREQAELSEIVYNIDRLFEDESENDNLENKQRKFCSSTESVTTYSDVINILEQMEKEEMHPSLKTCYMQRGKKEELLRQENSESVDHLSHNDLMSYLDKADQTSFNELNKTGKKIQVAPKLEDLLRYTDVELAQVVIDLTLQLEEKSSCLQILQRQLIKEREQKRTADAAHSRLMNQKVGMERTKHEQIIKRHQVFVDQLIADKKQLQSRCEALMTELREMEMRHVHNTQATEHRYRIELARIKQMHEAAEKIKREKWMQAKTTRIKELTVRSVEQEMQTLIDKNQRELTELKCSHSREIDELELRAARRSQQQCEALREQLTADREKAIAGEREAMRIRFEKLVESEERCYQEQRRRLKMEQTTRVAEWQQREHNLQADRDKAVEAVKAECEEKLEVMQRRCDIHLKTMKETVELELTSWKTEYVKQQTEKMKTMETCIREACKRDRDREIELVIDRLEREANDAKLLDEQAKEDKYRHMQEKHEQHRSEMENIIKDLKAELAIRDVTITDIKNSLIQQREKYTQLQEDLRARDNDVMGFRAEIICLKKQIKDSQMEKEKELQMIYSRVKVSLNRKDEHIKKLTQDGAALREKCILLENLLEHKHENIVLI